MTRRELIAGALTAPVLLAKGRIDRNRISATTDEIGRTPQEALDFASQFRLRWVELRNVPGSNPLRNYALLSEAEIKRAEVAFAANGTKVSFLRSDLLKFAWPGASDANIRWESRKDDIHKACVTARLLDCDKLGVFTGQRVSDPKTAFQRIADELGQLAEIAGTYGVNLLIENEPSQNIGTSREIAGLMALLTSKWVGYNWNPQNDVPLKEKPFPDGYSALPKKRMLNAQFSSKGILRESPERLDWAGIVKALEKDGFAYRLGLETQVSDDTMRTAAHESMENMMRIVG
jgi:hypothetical protein